MRNLEICLLATAALLVLSQSATAQTRLVDGGSQVQVGRYTTVVSTPSVSDAAPLSVYARIGFPRSTVTTVGDALRHTLSRTGYHLLEATATDAVALQFMNLPLPDSQREIGPFEVQAILQTLLGPAWQLQRDPMRCLVWFTVAPGYEKFAAAALPTPAAVTAPVAAPVVAPVAVPVMSAATPEAP